MPAKKNKKYSVSIKANKKNYAKKKYKQNCRTLEPNKFYTSQAPIKAKQPETAPHTTTAAIACSPKATTKHNGDARSKDLIELAMEFKLHTRSTSWDDKDNTGWIQRRGHHRRNED